MRVLQTEDEGVYEWSCLEIYKGDVPVYAKKGYSFEFGSLYEEDKEQTLLAVGNEITGEGQPNLVISEYTGGAHCCLLFHIFQIGKNFKFIQTIDVAHSDGVDFENLDDDPALELPMSDWTFAYWNTNFASSPAPSVILKYADGKYRIATSLMRKPPLEKKKLEEIAIDLKGKPEWNDKYEKFPSDLWREMLGLVYTGNMNQAWQLFEMAWPKEVTGREEFLKDFKATLKTSKFWEEIKKMNED